jgi:hypothetical protein
MQHIIKGVIKEVRFTVLYLGCVIGLANSLLIGKSWVGIPVVSRDFIFFKMSKLALGFL